MWGGRDAARTDAETRDRWAAQRGAALAVRLVVLLAPVGVAIAASFTVTRLVAAPSHGGARTLWLGGVISLCGLVAWPARRWLRRLLPLAALLELSILFPGEAPSRWKVARQAGTLRHLELLASGVPDTEPVKAATTILALVASLARHDRVTRGHSERVRVFTDMIAEEMALLKADRDRLRWAALVHDVGKLEVPGRLLRKPSKPSTAEWETLRRHPEVGARLTAPLADWLGPYARVVAEHHERFDGTGYPLGLRGDDISLGARIVALADAFEVMTAARPYKKAFSRAAALREVVRCSGTHFDPSVVRAFLAVSTPRLRRALGPTTWVGQIPVVSTAPTGGLPAVAGTVARGAGSVVLTGVAGAVVVSGTGIAHVVDLSAEPAVAMADQNASQHQAAALDMGAQATGRQASVLTSPDGGATREAGSGALGSAVATNGDSNLASSTTDSGDTTTVGPTGDTPSSTSTSSQPPAAPTPGELPSGTPSETPSEASTAPTPSAASTGLGAVAGGAVSGAGNILTQTTGALGDTLGGPVGSAVSDTGAALGSTVDSVGQAAGSTVNGITNVVGSAVDQLGSALGGLLGSPTNATASPVPTTSAPSTPTTPMPSPTPSSSPSGTPSSSPSGTPSPSPSPDSSNVLTKLLGGLRLR